jgi:hypothetical protein
MATSLSLENDSSSDTGYIKVNGTTAATLTTSGITGNLTGNATTATTATKLSTASGSAPSYACRAWVNFDGTRDTTGAASTANTNRLIRSSGNVTSVLRNGTGDYTITFTTPMSDANYSVSLTTLSLSSTDCARMVVVKGVATTGPSNKTTSAISIISGSTSGALTDLADINCTIFGN